jgi:maltooligosyltrehalose trehalohydrolase
MGQSISRRFPIGAECHNDRVSLRLWAPGSKRVTAVIEDRVEHAHRAEQGQIVLEPEGDGYFIAVTSKMRAGSCYRYRLDDGDALYPDPASRFQPAGPLGPSQIVAADGFAWTDDEWPGMTHAGQVIYELHVGTFSQAGTWRGAEDQLADLADLGVKVVEIMPVIEFCGAYGWGYDGVNLFAPTHLYGAPDDFRSFVDRAHALGIGVVLDVVYNHFGPEGNFLHKFSPDYFTNRYHTDWGAAINYDGPRSQAVREFVTSNAAYWISEYHLDGLRVDATQNIYDSSPRHILSELTQAARAAAGTRTIFVVAENEEQNIRHVLPETQDGYGMDALWNDDLHHTAMVALTGRAQAYYSDYRGTPQEFISAAKYGYLYQGQRYEWQQQNRGTCALRVAPACFVTFLENHDQVANSGRGLRCHQMSSPGRFRALTAYLLLGPGTPMLFQGQEFNASSPFFYFADHPPELAKLVYRGRNKSLAQFPNLASPHMQALLSNPAAQQTFERSKLDWSERETHREALHLHRDLLRLRLEDPVISGPSRPFDGAVLSSEAFVLRFFAPDGDDRLLLVNLGTDLELMPVPEPLMAAPSGKDWSIRWSSEDPSYGGLGVMPLRKNRHLLLPGNSALLLVPAVAADSDNGHHSESKGDSRDQ